MLIWVGEDRLDPETKEEVQDRANAVFVSAATIWELEIKQEVGKLSLPEDPAQRVDKSGYERLAITFEHAREAAHLPPLHGDPFDRMLIAQTRVEGLVLVTADPQVRAYDVPVLTAAATTSRSRGRGTRPRRGRRP